MIDIANKLPKLAIDSHENLVAKSSQRQSVA